MNNIKKITAILFALFAMTSLAFAMSDVITMRITRHDGSKDETPVKLEKINDNTMRLHLSYKQFGRNGKNAYSKVKYADFISDDATANKGDDGYWVLSDGRLGKFEHDNGILEERRNPMQMYGFKKGNEAFVAIVKKLKYEFSMVVEVKNGVYKMYPRFHISEIGTPIYQDIVIDFTYFKGNCANYSSMGKEYRKYQLERGEVRPLKERVKGNPRLKYTTESIFLKFQTAIFMYDFELDLNLGMNRKEIFEPNIKQIRNFDNLMGALKKLKALGVNEADIIVTNWNWRSNGRCPIYGVAEPELGGNAKCRELTALAKKLGYQIAPHIIHTENYTVSPAFNEADLAKQKNGEYIHYNGMGGEAYNPCFKQVYYKHILENYTNIQQLGFNGPIHIDVTSAIVPYQCFNLHHFCTRNDTAFYMNQIGLISDGFFGGWTSEASCDHVANTMDYIFYVSAYPRYLGKANPLITRLVPIWQIAYHGIIMSNPFLFTVDFNTRKGGRRESPFTVPELRLKVFEFGGRPSYYGHLMYDENFEDVKTTYDEYQKVKHLQLEFMDYHDEIAPNVFVTKYSDGSQIITNYTDKDFNYKNKGIVKAKDYKLFPSTKK